MKDFGEINERMFRISYLFSFLFLYLDIVHCAGRCTKDRRTNREFSKFVFFNSYLLNSFLIVFLCMWNPYLFSLLRISRLSISC